MRTVPLLLSGMMGAGKSTVGRHVATTLGRPFIDLDEAIVERAGRSIPAIFDADGEAAFRALEAAELRQVLDGDASAVVALGGGALIDDSLRQEALDRAVVVGLDATVDTLVDRLEDDSGERPKLAAGDRRATLRQLLDSRRAAYAAAPIHVRTDGRAVEDVAAEVVERAVADERLFIAGGERRRLVLQTDEGPCPLHIGRGVIDQLDDALTAVDLRPGPVFVVVDEGAAAFGDQAEAALTRAGHQVTRTIFTGSEAAKTPATLARLWSEAAAAKMARDRPFISVGGGVCGDVTGFAAATYQRGVPFVQVPTTLLAMIDASVGGKTAVDLPEGKNLAGAFHQPRTVLLDREALTTLPPNVFRQGVAEMIKHALLDGEEALDDLLTCTQRPFGDALAKDGWLDDRRLRRSVAVKARIVAADYREGGLRRVLNLGHTFAHALELCAGYAVPHGDAVAIGLCAALRFRADHPPSRALLPRVEALLRWAGLPTAVDEALDDTAPSPEALADAMAGDKKVKDGQLHLVLLDAVGRPIVVPVTDASRLRATWEQSMSATGEGQP
jgi:shikimate kinase/3-dehydroquinate synthase